MRDACWTTITAPDGTTRPKMTPEGLYNGRCSPGSAARSPTRRAAQWTGWVYVAFILDVYAQMIVDCGHGLGSNPE